MSLLQRIKKYYQFKNYRKGYRDGYYSACEKLEKLDGRLARINDGDILTIVQFYKNPSSKSYKPYYYGFKFGVTEAYSFYNSGENPIKSSGTLIDIYMRVQQEFENDLWEIDRK